MEAQDAVQYQTMKTEVLVKRHWRSGLPVRQHYRSFTLKGNSHFKSKINRVLKANPGMFSGVRTVRIEPASHARMGVPNALARTDVSFNAKGSPVKAHVKILPNMSMKETAKTMVHEHYHVEMDKHFPKFKEHFSEIIAQEGEKFAKTPG